jgi:hypothetical protein
VIHSKMVNKASTCTSVPNEAHFAVVIFKARQESRYQEDYSPPPRGGGGSYYTETIHTCEYWYTTDKQELIRFIEGIKLEGNHNFTILEVKGQLKAVVSLDLV